MNPYTDKTNPYTRKTSPYGYFTQSRLLQENGFFLLLEDGEKIVLSGEFSGTPYTKKTSPYSNKVSPYN